MIKRAEDQEGEHIGEDKLRALKGKGSVERHKAAGERVYSHSASLLFLII